ncbi:MAG: type II secretion system protein GspE, partial [Candidatus Parabeggiatoa sp. nov. 3]
KQEAMETYSHTMKVNKNIELYHPQGCQLCIFIGYRGRSGIYELINLDNTLRTMIHDGAGQQALESYAHQHSADIQQDGMRWVLAGTTTLDELLRVTQKE